jgi:hypothetical protein
MTTVPLFSQDLVKGIMHGLNMSYVDACAAFQNLTGASALKQALLPGGGHVLGVFGTWAGSIPAWRPSTT